jgi:hypothetical protein
MPDIVFLKVIIAAYAIPKVKHRLFRNGFRVS